MNILKFDAADAGHMRTVQGVVTRALIPFRYTTEAALVVFALARCMKILIGLYPVPMQRQLVSVLCDYFENPDKPTEGEQSPLWMPES
jgi:hypothetical protein